MGRNRGLVKVHPHPQMQTTWGPGERGSPADGATPQPGPAPTAGLDSSLTRPSGGVRSGPSLGLASRN